MHTGKAKNIGCSTEAAVGFCFVCVLFYWFSLFVCLILFAYLGMGFLVIGFGFLFFFWEWWVLFLFFGVGFVPCFFCLFCWFEFFETIKVFYK